VNAAMSATKTAPTNARIGPVLSVADAPSTATVTTTTVPPPTATDLPVESDAITRREGDVRGGRIHRRFAQSRQRVGVGAVLHAP
jgi:hypothetical protein